MKKLTILLSLIFVFLQAANLLAGRLNGYQYLSPVPGAKNVSRFADIIMRLDNVSPQQINNLHSCIRVEDENGLPCAGDIKIASDNKTIIFKPRQAFAPGAVIRVSLSPQIFLNDNKLANSYTFAVSAFEQMPVVADYADDESLAKAAIDVGPWYFPALKSTTLKKSAAAANGVSVPSDFPPVVITVNDNPDSGYIFIDNWGGTPYNIIFNNAGEPIWYHRNMDQRRDFKVQKNGLITMLVRTGYPFGQGFIALDNTYSEVDSFHAVNGYGTDEHELQVLADGHYLLIGIRDTRVDMSQYVEGGSRNATVSESIIQEFTPQHEMIFEWRAWDHFDIADTEVPGQNDLRGNSIRFPHMNAIDIDDDGNILLSSRHLSEVTKINRQTGEIIWRLGGPKNQFTFINDPLNGPENQHDVRVLGNGHYTVFDNGNEHNPPVSRAVEWVVDADSMTATLVWQFRDTPDKYTYWMGNHQRLPNGNRLINWADWSLPKITEVRENGEKAFEMWWRDAINTYRVHRFPWQGVAKEPYLIVESQRESVNLIFNKFGDKKIAYYNIYAGTSPSPTTVFDTSKATAKSFINLENGQRYYFRVTAVDNNGAESSFSNEGSAVPNFVEPGSNMVANGDFSSGKQNWYFNALEGGVATWNIEDGVSHIDIVDGSDQDYKVQLVQLELELLRGEDYIFSFDAWAAEPRLMSAFLLQYGEPWTNYSQTSFVSLRTQRQHFEYSFTMNYPSDFNALVVFAMGGNNADVFLDNISVRRLVESNVTDKPAQKPGQYELSGNFPNPFNGQTTIKFALPAAGPVKIELFDLLGRFQKEITNKEFAAGLHQVNVDAAPLSSGVYFYRLSVADENGAEQFSAWQKMMLVK